MSVTDVTLRAVDGPVVEESFATIWEALADALPDHVVLRRGQQALTWRQFEERATRLAASWQAAGIGAGSKVGFYLGNCCEYLEGVFAAFKLRAVPVNVNYRYREAELEHLLRDADVELLLCDAALGERVRAVRDRLPLLRTCVEIGGVAPDATSYQDMLAGHVPMDRVARSADDQLLMYTGGTTGLPKGVVWPHRTMIRPISVTAYGVRGLVPPRDVREVVELARELAGSPDQPVTLAACPFIHAHALFTSFGTLQSGGTVVIAGAEGFDADEMWRTVEGRRVTDVLIVGDAFSRRMVDALAEADRRGDAPDLSSLRYVISAGVGWSPDAKQAMLSRCDARLVDMLAASEGGPFAIDIISPADGGRPPRFRAGPSTKLFTAGGEEIAAGSEEAGFLGVSDAIPLGYFKDEAKTAQTFRTIGGIRYAIPGDLARIEPDGTLILLGREAAVINTGGEKVFAEEVERVILSHPAIADCNVVGVPDERWGQAVAAVVALRPGQELAERDVIDHVGGRLANYKRPKRVAFVPAVERGPAGKSDLQWARRVLAEAP